MVLLRFSTERQFVSMSLEGVREKLKAVPDWKERLREFVDQWMWENPTQE